MSSDSNKDKPTKDTVPKGLVKIKLAHTDEGFIIPVLDEPDSSDDKPQEAKVMIPKGLVKMKLSHSDDGFIIPVLDDPDSNDDKPHEATNAAALRGRPTTQRKLPKHIRYAGKPRHHYPHIRPLQITPRTFRHRMEVDTSFRKMIMSGQYACVHGYLFLTPIAYEIRRRRLPLTHPMLAHLLPYLMLEDTLTLLKVNADKVSVNVGVMEYSGGSDISSRHIQQTHNLHMGRAVQATTAASGQLITANRVKALFNQYPDPPKKGPPADFREMLIKIIGKNNQQKIAELTGIDERKIRRIKNENYFRPQLGELVAICVAVNADPEDSFSLLELAGYKLRSVPEERMYRIFLNMADVIDVPYCNMLLAEYGFGPLVVNKPKNK